MTDAPSKPVLAEEAAPIIDVWSRTSPKYRRRAVLMLLILAALFAGLCCFTFWLRTGVYWPWQSEKYAEVLVKSFRPAGTEQITLSDFLTKPISVKEVPVHGLIMGLLLASLSCMPLLVAILYRFPFSIPFAIMVMFLAAMPWLGITVLAGCLLTTLKPFRFSFRYASALVGLIPIAIYFVSASWQPAGAETRLVQHKALLYAPWVLAVLGSCIIAAVALGIARLINYRPGGTPPLLAVLFALPVILFYTQVGSDELEYRLLEEDLGPGRSSLFGPASRWNAACAAIAAGSPEDGGSPLAERKSPISSGLADLLRQEADARSQAIARCDDFILRCPKSRHVPNVLFLKGQVQDRRVLEGRLSEGVLEYRNDLPCWASRVTWQTLVERFPEENLTALALHKLAILHVREGRIPAAIQLLEQLVERFDLSPAASPGADAEGVGNDSLFQKVRASTRLGVDPVVLVRQAYRLKEMLEACLADPTLPYEDLFVVASLRGSERLHPMQLLAWLDDGDSRYAEHLAAIIAHFPNTRSADYIRLRLIMLEPAREVRIRRLEAAAESLTARPARAEALFRLASAYLESEQSQDRARATMEALVKDYGETSCWAREARRALSSLPMLETPPP